MRDQGPLVRINFASVDITGGPGLAVVGVVVATALEFREARWLLLSGLSAGALLAVAMILVRRSSLEEPSLGGPGNMAMCRLLLTTNDCGESTTGPDAERNGPPNGAPRRRSGTGPCGPGFKPFFLPRPSWRSDAATAGGRSS
jgi:hypothetical protein